MHLYSQSQDFLSLYPHLVRLGGEEDRGWEEVGRWAEAGPTGLLGAQRGLGSVLKAVGNGCRTWTEFCSSLIKT